MIEVTRRYDFPAAHVLASQRLGREENEEIFGKCANPNGHGHNYGVEVTVTGTVDPETGQIVPPDVLDGIFQATVGEPLAHRMLNEVGAFEARVPTAENIARVVHELLESEIASHTGARLARVRIIETPRNSSEYGD